MVGIMGIDRTRDRLDTTSFFLSVPIVGHEAVSKFCHPSSLQPITLIFLYCA